VSGGGAVGTGVEEGLLDLLLLPVGEEEGEVLLELVELPGPVGLAADLLAALHSNTVKVK
jgi:hypothetical protein